MLPETEWLKPNRIQMYDKVVKEEDNQRRGTTLVGTGSRMTKLEKNWQLLLKLYQASKSSATATHKPKRKHKCPYKGSGKNIAAARKQKPCSKRWSEACYWNVIAHDQQGSVAGASANQLQTV